MRADDDSNNRPRPLPRPTNPPDGPPKPPRAFDDPGHLSWAARMVQISLDRQGLAFDDLEAPARAEAGLARAA